MKVLLASPRGFCAGVDMAIECLDEANAVIQRLRQRYPHIVSPATEDICYATTNRQDAIKAIPESADVLVVLGSQNSSNSRRLMEKGLSKGVPSYLVDAVGELQLEWFTNVETVVVTAGASARVRCDRVCQLPEAAL